MARSNTYLVVPLLLGFPFVLVHLESYRKLLAFTDSCDDHDDGMNV